MRILTLIHYCSSLTKDRNCEAEYLTSCHIHKELIHQFLDRTCTTDSQSQT